MDKQITELGALVADRQALFRHGLVGLLREARPGWSFDQAGTLDSMMERLALGSTHLILLDIDLPGLGGAEGLQQVRTAEPDCTLVVLADTDDRATILECLNNGAQGYVLKSTNPAQFLRALETVLAGGVYAPASLAGRPLCVARPVARPQAAAEGGLGPVVAQFTDRQRDVFRLLAEGCATKTIARRLDLAVGTVKVHLAAIYRALGAHSRLEALAKARSGMMWPGLLMPAGNDPRCQDSELTTSSYPA